MYQMYVVGCSAWLNFHRVLVSLVVAFRGSGWGFWSQNPGQPSSLLTGPTPSWTIYETRVLFQNGRAPSLWKMRFDQAVFLIVSSSDRWVLWTFGLEAFNCKGCQPDLCLQSRKDCWERSSCDLVAKLRMFFAVLFRWMSVVRDGPSCDRFSINCLS